MAHQLRDHAGSVNLRCLPCGTRALILPAAGGQRAAAYLRRLGWYYPRCAVRLTAGDLDADALMDEREHAAAKRLDAILDAS